MSNLLLDEHPLQVMPTLATIIGLNESIILQQIHYWLKNKEQARRDYIKGRHWVYNTYEQWQQQFPFWSKMTIRRTITKLENQGLLLTANHNKAGFDKTKWYTIDYSALGKLFSSSVQNEHIVCSDCTDGTGQNEHTNTIEYTETTSETSFKVLNGSTLKRGTTFFDWSILEKQIIKSCHKHDITDCTQYIEIIKYYYSAYMDTFNQEHPRLSTAAMDNVVSALWTGTDIVDDMDIEVYQPMIDKHFQTQYSNCDYSICHFMTEGIRDNRYYETGY